MKKFVGLLIIGIGISILGIGAIEVFFVLGFIGLIIPIFISIPIIYLGKKIYGSEVTAVSQTHRTFSYIALIIVTLIFFYVIYMKLSTAFY
ncbi:MAG: hypothetical protein UV61_C0009G0007 [Candidatus Gottesmanbacteria bacterium GW2011_GWB1_43_11]|uniref:Uncharacterized protein n=1 Tax=Candidatus Gottesmanbacteria bacterium GW2011_GWB1_43_11 TaxID=1618446 RepID=A0A0G1CKY2_9BACT|nr:MAG: hypothetical protein UV17_C0024G0004 [Candidatus Gottesmanbacteria bacterium GW2011_GWA1_42_26]KKS81361.1 MAG: hypothetical protein UV55_C0015G0007 [Candidatus Gottesmanbacteria bacterium GW2011_GWC1_43_10]KKS86480.1 MAG: hypothetical protein UV61_C0009G0007 [Candidatus Gottesmanbacteria bacterium GW2011_GWB1_43_11]OGG10443.1 MAG: hypothetical protein A2699_04370 [Candidatus Gottesmanbacteria bacterium RIFCSPHIGHO2_01_FULL_43_15]OGG28160.1 MAG: hypothetical protein A3A59_03985 [Candidat